MKQPQGTRTLRSAGAAVLAVAGAAALHAAPRASEAVMTAIIVGAPSLDPKPVGKSRFYGANDPRRNIGLALAY